MKRTLLFFIMLLLVVMARSQTINLTNQPAMDGEDVQAVDYLWIVDSSASTTYRSRRISMDDLKIALELLGLSGSDSVTLTGSYDYITIGDGQVITVGQIDLAADVTGTLPDGSFTKTGDWMGTLDGQEGSYYLDYGNFTNTPSLATVATSGDYDDLSNKPTIPSIESTTFSEELTFNANKIMALSNRDIQDSSYSFTKAVGGAAGYVINYYIQANGDSTFNFSSDFIILSSSITEGGTLTADVTYLFSFLYDNEKVLVSVSETDATPLDITPPTVASAVTVSETEILITFDEPLNTDNSPATSSLIISEDASPFTTSSITLNYGSNPTQLLLTISGTISEGTTLTADYTKPGSNPLKDLSDNEAESFSDLAITNNIIGGLQDVVWINGGSHALIDGNNLDSNNAANWTNSYAQTTNMLASGNDGSIQADAPNGSLTRGIIGFQTTNSSTTYSSYEYGVYCASVYFRVVSGALTNTGITVEADDIYRLVRESGNIKAQYYRGGSWNDIYDFGTYAGDLWVNGNASSNANDGVKNAQQEGLTP